MVAGRMVGGWERRRIGGGGNMRRIATLEGRLWKVAVTRTVVVVALGRTKVIDSVSFNSVDNDDDD